MKVRDAETERDHKNVTMTNDMIAKTFMQFFIDGYDTVTTQLAMTF